MRSRRFIASRMRETAACIWGSKNGSPSDPKRGRRNASTSSAQRNPFRKSNRAMHSDPQISPHEMTLPFNSSGGARIHRCCTEHFIRGQVSDKTHSSCNAFAATIDESEAWTHRTPKVFRAKSRRYGVGFALALGVHTRLRVAFLMKIHNY